MRENIRTHTVSFLFFCLLIGSNKIIAQNVMFRGNATHSGNYHTKPLNNYGGILWHFQTGGPVRSSPVIADHRLFIGSDDGFIYALNAKNGALIWKFNAQSPVSATPAVTGKRVFCATRDNRILSLNAENGKMLWVKKTGSDTPLAWGYETGDVYNSSPVVVGEKVVVGSGDGFLYVFNSKNGTLLWKKRTGGRIRSSPAIDKDVIYFGSFDGSLYAVKLSTGQEIWRFDTQGSRLNSKDFGFDRKSIQSSPAVFDENVYFGARDGFLYAVNVTDGKLRWRFDHEESWVNTSPAVAEKTVYAASSDGHFLQAVNAETGQEIWRFSVNTPIWSSPAIVEGYIYTCDFAGNLYALNNKTGILLWRFKTQKRIFSSPLIDEGRIFFGSDDGNIYALGSGEKESLKRSVFWDADHTKGATFRGNEIIRDYLKDNDYEVLSATELTKFIKERIKDHIQSVIVFSIDHLPRSVGLENDGSSLLRKYLESGGKVVWLGTTPLIWDKDLQTGERGYDTIDRPAAEKLLSIDHKNSNFEMKTTRATPEGKKFYLDGWWNSNFGIDSRSVTTVFATDDQGFATAWMKNYGGRKGTGFYRLPVIESVNGSPLNLQSIKFLAEYFPN